MRLADGAAWEQENVCLIRHDDGRTCVRPIHHMDVHQDYTGRTWARDPLGDRTLPTRPPIVEEPVTIAGIIVGFLVGIILIFILGVAGVLHGATSEVEKHATQTSPRVAQEAGPTARG